MANQHAQTFNFCGMEFPVENVKPGEAGSFGPSPGTKASRSVARRVAIQAGAKAKPFECQECGQRMTTKQAERASFGERGCLKCGGSDIDLATTR